MSSWSLTAAPLGFFDGVVALAVLAAMGWIAKACGAAKPSPDDAFLSRRSLPWWALAASLAAAELSALTLVGVPASVTGGDWAFAQFFIGSLAARVLLGLSFIPAFCDGKRLTCYEWLAGRFGHWTGRSSGAIFCAAKVAGAALRVVAASIAASMLTGIGPAWWALILCAAAAAYIGYGGFRAVVWTGFWQLVVIVLVVAATTVYMLAQTPQHVHGALRLAAEGERLGFWHAAPSWSDADFWRRWFSDPDIFWVAVLNGFVGTLATLGCDYDFAQRLMACQNPKEGRKVLALATVGSLLILTLLLVMGTCLYAYYRSHPALAVPESLDRLLPHFAATVLPAPLRGLVLAAVLLSAIDLPLSALSAVAVGDVWPKAVRELSLRGRVLLSGGWAALILGFSLWLFGRQDMLWIGGKGAGTAVGPLLGLFLLGLFTKVRGDITTALVALVLSVVLLGNLVWLSRADAPTINWGWMTIAGTAATAAISYGLWRFYRRFVLS